MEQRRPAAPVVVEAAPLVTEEDHVQAGLVRLPPTTTPRPEFDKEPDAVAEVPPSKGDNNMPAFTRLKVWARYERTTGKTFVKVEAWGDAGHGGITLAEVEPHPGCYQDTHVLCVEIKFDPYQGGAVPWSSREKSFDGSADFVVVLYDEASKHRVLTVKPIDKVDKVEPLEPVEPAAPPPAGASAAPVAPAAPPAPLAAPVTTAPPVPGPTSR